MNTLSLVSRRAILKGMTSTLLGARLVCAQTRILSTPRPLAKDAVTHD